MNEVAAGPTVLLIDDDQELNRLVVRFLQSNGFRVLTETDGGKALERIDRERPELIVLDVMLPGMDGLSICRQLRTFHAGPVLMLTALGEDIDEVAGLEIGADDYLAKPVRPRVLLARVRALLRRRSDPRPRNADDGLLEVGDLVVNRGKREITLHGRDVRVTSAEFDLLGLLAEHVGEVMSRDTICRRLSGRDYDGIDRRIDLRISRLRRKLGDDPDDPAMIKSVRSVGYMLARH